MTESIISPEEAFSELGNETRIDIIRVLGETDAQSLSFSEIYEQVDIQDSGQFNYHLDRLVDTFVHQTEAGEYELSYAGSRVVGAIFSGEFTRSGSTETVVLESDCIACGTQVEATYQNENVSINCPHCGEIESGFGFPPGGIEGRSPAELTTVFDTWLKSVFRLIRQGICDNCTGTLTGHFTDESEYLREDDPVCLEFVCTRCADTATLSVNSYLLYHPGVVDFFTAHGKDLFAIDIWNLTPLGNPTISVISASPWNVETTFELDDSRLTIVLDDDLNTTVE